MIQENPPPFIIAKPTEKNVLEWHYVITGPPDSPYAGILHTQPRVVLMFARR